MDRPIKKTKYLNIRIGPEDKKLIEDTAAYNRISVSELIIMLIHDLISEGGKTIKSEVRLKSPVETGQRA